MILPMIELDVYKMVPTEINGSALHFFVSDMESTRKIHLLILIGSCSGSCRAMTGMQKVFKIFFLMAK